MCTCPSSWCVFCCVDFCYFYIHQRSLSTTACTQNQGHASHYFSVIFHFNAKWEDTSEVVCKPEKSKRKFIFNTGFLFDVCLLGV